MPTFTGKRTFKLLLAAILSVLLGCSDSNQITNDENKMHTFDLAEFFDGTTKGTGFIQDRSGAIIRTFNLEVIGQFSNSKGSLKETFFWNDGEIEHRTWNLEKTSETEWIGTAHDVVGKATGIISEDKLRWSYTLTLNVSDRKINFKFDDQMWISETGVLVNHAKFTKFGIHLGDVVVSFSK